MPSSTLLLCNLKEVNHVIMEILYEEEFWTRDEEEMDGQMVDGVMLLLLLCVWLSEQKVGW